MGVISWRRARLDIALVRADSQVVLQEQVPLTEGEDRGGKDPARLF